MEQRTPTKLNPFAVFRKFAQLESAGGIMLFSAAVLALVIDNSPWHHFYQDFFQFRLIMELGVARISKPLISWINDGLMSVFFLLVSLEVKREFIEGELNSWAKIALPGIVAVGGMLVPALIFILFNHHDAKAMHGWAIPTATDIAFALGVMQLLRSRVPISLKVFLTAVAIFDDIGAIIIIAAFYSSGISIEQLLLAIACLLILFLMHYVNIRKIFPYCIIGFILWLCVLRSGVHATLAGVVLAFAIPLGDNDHSPLRRLEDNLHPWVAFVVLPLFGFANAGVSFQGVALHSLFDPLLLGIAGGLFVGKQIGVFSASWLAVKLKLAKMPTDANWLGMYGVALICGIGFTMSLFIAGLAFNNFTGHYILLSRFGVICGSLLSGILGYFFLRSAYPKVT